MKALGTYLCWTQLQLGNHYVQVLNCYLQPGEQQNLKERAMRVAEVVRDIIKQDPNAPIVVCGDFNNHMTYIVEQLGPLSFTAAVEPSTETHRQGGHLDQVFARNMTFGEVNLSPGYSDEVSDHKCLNVILKLQDPKLTSGN
jgi:endonuclease/exonuclease/phosphatase family metal-dependent hydrolase